MRRLGPQVASRTRASRHQEHGGQSASKSCSSNSAGGRQTHALHGLPGECQNVISSCDQWKSHGAWSSSTDGQFLLETHHEGGACQRHAVGGCVFKSGCGSDLANCTPSGTSGKCVRVGSEANVTRVVVQVLRTSRNSHDRPGMMLSRTFVSGMDGLEKREVGSPTS